VAVTAGAGLRGYKTVAREAMLGGAKLWRSDHPPAIDATDDITDVSHTLRYTTVLSSAHQGVPHPKV
jgi:hypothetical protein